MVPKRASILFFSIPNSHQGAPLADGLMEGLLKFSHEAAARRRAGLPSREGLGCCSVHVRICSLTGLVPAGAGGLRPWKKKGRAQGHPAGQPQHLPSSALRARVSSPACPRTLGVQSGWHGLGSTTPGADRVGSFSLPDLTQLHLLGNRTEDQQRGTPLACLPPSLPLHLSKSENLAHLTYAGAGGQKEAGTWALPAIGVRVRVRVRVHKKPLPACQ
uniref:Uncharacterized protein LOC109551233 n=1 Tax=Tursiops truncatus TaxID=9739 RepID=A0A2U4C0I1_TURTR|nr:uncharacterized protein LOC109551233 [Tursiops truncatus]